MYKRYVIIGPDNGLSSVPRQAITKTNNDVLLFGRIATNFNDTWMQKPQLSYKEKQ